MAYKVLTLFTINLGGSLASGTSIAGKNASQLLSSPADVSFAIMGGLVSTGDLTYYVTPNRVANQTASGSRGDYITGATAVLPAVRFTFAVHHIAAQASVGTVSKCVAYVGLDTATMANGPASQTLYYFGWEKGVGWVVYRQDAGVDTRIGVDPSAANFTGARDAALEFTFDPSGQWSLSVDGVVPAGLSGVDPAPINLAGKRIGLISFHTNVTPNAQNNDGFGGPMVLRSFTPKTGGGAGVDAGTRKDAPARTAAPIRQAA